MEIDYEKLREDLIDYFGSATPIFPIAFIDVSEIENASNQKLIEIAINNGFNINDYKIYTLNK